MLQSPVYELYTEEAVTNQIRYTVIDNVKYYAVRDIATKLLRYSQSNRVANNFPGIVKAKAYYNNQKVTFNFIKSEDVIKLITNNRTRATPEVMAWAMAVSKMKDEEPKELPTLENVELDQVFNFEGTPVRTVSVGGEKWFLGKEVANIVGYKRPQKAVNDLVDDEDIKTLSYKAYPNLGQAVWEGNDFSDKTIINESGLYTLMMTNKLDKTKRFRRWVTSEVLPSIRKHGAYMTPGTVEQAILNPDTMIQIATKLKEEQAERRRLEEQNQMLSVENKRNAVIVETHQKLYDDKRLFTTTQVASHFGFASVGFNRILANLGIQYKPEGSETWILYARYQGKGYTKTETFKYGDKAKMITKWTNKGREFLYKKLKKAGVIDEDWGYKK